MAYLKSLSTDDSKHLDDSRRNRKLCNHEYRLLSWNPDFSNPYLFKPSSNSTKLRIHLRSQTLILSLISIVSDFSKQLSFPLGGSKNRNSTVMHASSCRVTRNLQLTDQEV